VSDTAQPQPRVAVLYRTHVWDAAIASLAQRVRDASAGADFFVLADETNGPLPIEDFAKFSHAAGDFAPIGLADESGGGNLLWYNGDYPLYRFLVVHPDYDIYVMVEFDVVATRSLAEIGRIAHAQAIDLIAHSIVPAPAEWPWHATGRSLYPAVHRALIPLLFLSHRALAHLFERRLDLSRRFRAREIAAWPYCEAFVPSEIVGAGRFNVRELAEFGDCSRLDWWPPMLDREAAAVQHPAFMHPVLDQRRYVDAWRRSPLYRPLDYIDPRSDLRRGFDACEADLVAALVVPDVLHAIRRAWRGRHDEVRALAGALPPAPAGLANVALGKPATQSSVSSFSITGMPEQDAAGAVDGLITGRFAFHTAHEDRPWWAVDLAGPHLVQEIRLYNRMDQPGRARHLSLLVSADRRAWRLLLRKQDDADFGGLDGRPLIVRLRDAVLCRHLRVRLDEPGCLHLDQVEVYAQPVTPSP